jgi:hypothetical protein
MGLLMERLDEALDNADVVVKLLELIGLFHSDPEFALVAVVLNL